MFLWQINFFSRKTRMMAASFLYVIHKLSLFMASLLGFIKKSHYMVVYLKGYKRWIMIICNIIHKVDTVHYKTFLCLTSTIWREQRDFLVCDFPIKFIHFLLLELHQLKLPTCFKNSTYFSTGIFVSFLGCFNKYLVRTASCFIHAGMQTTELPAGSSDYL